VPQKRKAIELDEEAMDSASATGGSEVLDPAQHLDDSDGGHEADSEVEEDNMDSFLDAVGAELKAGGDVREWPELREQIKSDLQMAEKTKATPTQWNQLLIL